MELLILIGTYSGPLGAVVLAANLPISKYGYLLFTISAFIMAWHGFRNGDDAVFHQNALFLVINLFGVYRWVICGGKHAETSQLAKKV